MIVRFFALFLILWSTAHAEITAQPAGIQAIWEDGGDHFGGFKTFNASKGIHIVLHLKSDGASFVDLDDEGCDVRIAGMNADTMFFGQEHDFSKDKKMMKVKFDADGAKAKAGKVKVEGHLSVMTGSKTQTAATDLMDWKKGATFKFPAASKLPAFKVTKVGKPDWGDEKWAVSIQAKDDFQAPIRVFFEEPDGTRHEAKQGGSSRMSFGKHVTVDLEYKTKKEVGRSKMVVEYWGDLKKEKVPLSFELTL